MNRTLRRLFSFLLAFIFVFLAVDVNINAQSDVTDIGIAKYKVEEIIAQHELSYGVKHQTVKAFTSAAAGEVTSMGIGITDKFVANKDYQQQVNVLEVPSLTSIKIRPWANLLQGEWTLSTVRSMAKDYEAENPGSKVIAAINADFFDINSKLLFPKTPSGAHVSNGEFYKTLTGSAVGFTNDGSNKPLIGNQPLVRTSNMILSVYDENDNIVKDYTINKINTAPGEGEIAIYYAKWDLQPGWSSQKIIPIDVENAIIVNKGEYALPSTYVNVDKNGPKTEDFYGKGVITKIGNDTLSTGDFAIVSNNEEITNALKVGTKIRAQYKYTGNFANINDIIGVGQTVLFDGTKRGSDTNRHPRTMIGLKEDGTIVMTVVDGRQQDKLMYGASQAEMAAILKHYGCVEGYNLDGGGSSTMLILNDDGDLEVTNSPSDGRERSDSNCILVTIDVPDINYGFSEIQPNAFTFNAEVVDKNGIDFDNLYIKINDEMKKIENGKATFTNLNPNSSYKYTLYGEKDKVYNNIGILGTQKTAKRLPKINKVDIFVDGDDYTFKVAIDDPDEAISRRSISIGDKTEMYNKDQITFKDYVEDITNNLSFGLSYDLNDGKGRKDVSFADNEVTMHYGLLVYSKVTTNKFNRILYSIYKDAE